MNIRTEQEFSRVVLGRLPKATMPADLLAAIQRETIGRRPWYQTDSFQTRWLPAMVGLVTAFGVFWISRIQQKIQLPVPAVIVARPAAAPTQHAFLYQEKSSQTLKGESREHSKS